MSWSEARGWVPSDELQWLYRNHYVYLSDYYDDIDVPVVPFVLGTYWSAYYVGRPFFHRRAHFDHYSASHQSIAMRTPDRIARARTVWSRCRDRGRGRAEARTAIENRTLREHGRGAEARMGRSRPEPDLRGGKAARGCTARRRLAFAAPNMVAWPA